jgi:alpha-L-fucosidase
MFSTGGNVLINIGPTSYGTISPIFEERLRQMGSWLKVNGESIYNSIPWKYQNDTINSNVWYVFFQKENNKNFDFFYPRYTSSKDYQTVYAFLLLWPSNTTEIILDAPVSSSSTTVTLLGSNLGLLNWRTTGGNSGIIIDLSNVKIYSLASDWTWVFKLQNISAKETEKIQQKYRRW